MAPLDLSDARTFSRIYDDHARSVYGAALRILGNPAQAQDVTHDVFLRLWRRPRRVDARPARAAERAVDRSGVRAALAGLPDTQREALVLAYWGGLTADQIARRAGLPLGTVKSRIRLGMAKVRAELEGTAAAAA